MKNNLKRFRKEAGLTIQQLGDKAGVSKSQICDLQNDEANPTIRTAAKIAKALGIDRAEIFIIWP